MDLSLKKSFLTDRIGPLPTWAWMLIGLGAAITWSVVRSNKKASDAKATDKSTGDTTDGSGVDLIGGDQSPPIVFQSYVTSNFLPPAGGRQSPPVAPPPASTPPATTPPPPATTTAPPPPTTAPKGQWVTVARWTHHNAPWNSTLSGIAAHIYHNQSKWPSIWNAPQNAALKTRRKRPEEIRAGDKIWVPA